MSTFDRSEPQDDLGATSIFFDSEIGARGPLSYIMRCPIKLQRTCKVREQLEQRIISSQWM